MLEFADVTFVYPGAADSAVAGVSFVVTPGRITALAGPNGSGKSTLARLADGLAVPRSGSVRVDGRDTRDAATLPAIRADVGLVFQTPDDQIVGALVEEDVAFGPENLGVAPTEIRERVTAALAAVGLAGFERREPHLLSEGQKQRVALAGALAMEPSYLVLDEATAYLDAGARREVLALAVQAAHERGVGVLLVTHRAEEIALTDEVVVLAEGRVAWSGPPVDLLGDAALAARLGLDATPMLELGAALRAAGRPVPVAALDAEAVAAALWGERR